MKYAGIVLGMVVVLTAILYGLQPQLFSDYVALRDHTVPTGGMSDDLSDGDLTVVAKDLFVPWSIAFLPDGTMLVSERNGSLVRMSGEKLQRVAVDEVSEKGEGGLLGIALHPDFAHNRFLYLYMTSAGRIGDKKSRSALCMRKRCSQ